MNRPAGSDAGGREAWAVGLALGALSGLIVQVLNLSTIVSYRYDRTPIAVVGALAGALAWRRLWPRRLLVAATAGLGALWLVVAATPLAAWMAAGLVRRDAVAPADAVYVLASGVQPDGDLTTDAMSRLLGGLELIGDGLSGRLVLTEIRAPHGSYSAAARRLARRLGLRREPELYFVGPVASTRDEATAVATLCRRQGWRRLLIVTSPLHSRRAAASFEGTGLEVISCPSVETQYDLETLSSGGHRFPAFADALHERVGLWYYERRGWIAAAR